MYGVVVREASFGAKCMLPNEMGFWQEANKKPDFREYLKVRLFHYC